MVHELLSPAGSFEALKQAVYYGADAVYLSGKKFGARAFAPNFTEEELNEAIFYCHLHQVKVYVTVNTMIFESELEAVLKYIRFLYENHVDAIIMADLGLMKLCHEIFPELVIHASVQAYTHNVEQIYFLKKLGVKRVVLARELSLLEIEKFPKDMEIEIFIHGALCISYSGQCLFSSLLFSRSGNRGECAQICRLPFTLLKNGKKVNTDGSFLLSPKDLCTASSFSSLLHYPITSFKIEGRMKSPAYVGFVTRMYRSLIDQYHKTGTCKVEEEQIKKAAVLFGRGFTEGKLFLKNDKDFMNQGTSNHQGIFLGTVLATSKKKIKILLKEEIHQFDGIRFGKENKGMIVNFLYDKNGKLISSACKGDVIFLDNKIGIYETGDVMKTLDSVLEKEIVTWKEKKLAISIEALISLEQGFLLTLSFLNYQVCLQRNIVQKTKNSSLKKEQVESLLMRLGNTPFVCTFISVSLEDNLFINIRDINALRREGISKLIETIGYRKEVSLGSEKRIEKNFATDLKIYATARNEKQLKVLLDSMVDGIYVSDYSLYQKYQKEKVIYRTNRVQHSIVNRPANSYLVSELGSLHHYANLCSTDYFLNVANHATADFLIQEGVSRITLSPELEKKEIQKLLEKYPKGNPFEVVIYGRLEVMVMNHCLLKMNVNSSEKCQVCKFNDYYTLQDRNGAVYPILVDENHRTHLFYHEIIDYIGDLQTFYSMGIRNYRLEFFDEDEDEIKRIVNLVFKATV